MALVEAESSPTNLLVLDVKNKLIATGRFSTVDVIDALNTTPSLAQLQGYQGVLVWSDDTFADATTLGDNLDAYARAGGRVVVMIFANSDPGSLAIAGAFASNNDFPMTVANQTQGTELTLGTVNAPTSPLMSGVASFDGGTSSFNNPGVLTSGAVDVADYSNGTPLVAYKLAAGNPVVTLNFWPPSSDGRADLWVSSTDGTQLMANALVNNVTSSPVPVLEPWALAVLATGMAALGAAAASRRGYARARSTGNRRV